MLVIWLNKCYVRYFSVFRIVYNDIYCLKKECMYGGIWNLIIRFSLYIYIYIKLLLFVV